MAFGMDRRSFVQGLVAASVVACGGLFAGCGGSQAAPADSVERRSASALSAAEIDRFERAFAYAVAKGLFDPFNDEHYNHEKQRHHGADVMASSPIMVMQMSQASGYRLLPWHRSFLIEAEAMLRAALRQRDAEEGKDPSEADLLFIPYWDASHEQGLPAWVEDFQPKGGTAIVPPDLPMGHAGYGKPVGDRYDIVFGRWPGGNLVFKTLETPDYMARILAKTTFVDFYDAIDATPEIVFSNYGKAMAGLETLSMKLPNDTSVQKLTTAFSMGPSAGSSGDVDTTNALFEIGWEAAIEAQKPAPDQGLVSAVEDVYSVFNFMPHLRMHLWAGGLSPTNANVRGTVTYFNELAVDPVFWMLHADLDRTFYTWQKTHGDAPPLTGDDTIFTPLSSDEGAWYGGGKTYTLDSLMALDTLPYTYDALYVP
jgi:hypothetical protein